MYTGEWENLFVLEVYDMVLSKYLGVWRFKMCNLGFGRGFMCIYI